MSFLNPTRKTAAAMANSMANAGGTHAPAGPARAGVDRDPGGDPEFRLRSFVERYVIEARGNMPQGVTDEAEFMYGIAQSARLVFMAIGRMSRENAPALYEQKAEWEAKMLARAMPK